MTEHPTPEEREAWGHEMAEKFEAWTSGQAHITVGADGSFPAFYVPADTKVIVIHGWEPRSGDSAYA